MKILIVQLARLGDLLMTWPTVRGLRRMYPDAQIDLMVRRRFQGAISDLGVVDNIIYLPTEEILSPLITEAMDVDSTLLKMDEFVQSTKNTEYDRIINFTFSAFSSYLVDAVSGPETLVEGYSRHVDGTLKISDESSAYFYAQVGVGKNNRIHVSDILGGMAGVIFENADWTLDTIPTSSISLPARFITFHVGASEAHKRISVKVFVQMIQTMRARNQQIPVVLIGSDEESVFAKEIEALTMDMDVISLVGLTKVSDLFSVIQRSELLVGGDSVAIHIASLVDTATLNISSETVNFWETGPKATLGFIVKQNQIGDSGFYLGQVITDLLEGILDDQLIVRGPGLTSYVAVESAQSDFQWALTEAMYLGGSYPLADKIEIVEGAMKLNDINEFAMEQLNLIPTLGIQKVAPFLDSVEEVILNISQIVPELNPIINWYHAEKVRIPPGSLEDVRMATLNVHERFMNYLRVYIPQEMMREGVVHGEI